ncbi:MAG: phospholipase D family protein, partial [Betaproteobacteria bacterium]|nr:phospholipase D family protein [Betaproteobacteria bacterium]
MQLVARFLRVLPFGVAALIAAGCASLPPGADYPKAASAALAEPGHTRLGRQFEHAARGHDGNSAFRLLSVGVDGFLVRAQMIDAAARTLDLEYFIFRQDETGQLLADALLRAADRGVRVRLLVDDAETHDADDQLAALSA